MDHSTLIPDAVLTDVSHFIGNVLSGEKLSDVASQKRENVLKRLTVFVPVPATNQYIDMNAGSNKGSSPALQIVGLQPSVKNEYVGADNQVWEEEEYEECPAEMENYKIEQQALALEVQANVVNSSNIFEDSVKMQRSASELKSLCSKSGPLLRKERKFFIEKFRRCWAAVYESTLYFYASEGASKPACVEEIEGYKARPLTDFTKDVKKKDACFEIVCPGKKTFQLVARTAKDMQQWVAIICKEGGPTLPTRRQLPSIPGDGEGDEEYDDVGALRAKQDADLSTEDIYDDIKYHENSDDDSIYDDIGEIFPERGLNSRAEDKPQEESREVKLEVLISKPTNQETVEDEDFYDDIDVFMNRGPIESGTLNEDSHKASSSAIDTPPIPKVNINKEIESQNEENIVQEDIYDDVGILTNKEVSDSDASRTVHTDSPTKEEPKKLSNSRATTPVKVFPDKIINIPIKKVPSKEVPKNKIEHQIGKNHVKPVMLPKPAFKVPNTQGAEKPGGKNNIKNLIQQMESSLQMK